MALPPVLWKVLRGCGFNMPHPGRGWPPGPPYMDTLESLLWDKWRIIPQCGAFLTLSLVSDLGQVVLPPSPSSLTCGLEVIHTDSPGTGSKEAAKDSKAEWS